MPKLGESIMEATILKWHKKVGDAVQQDETVLDIATDKVDSEVPSTDAGILAEILFKENDVVPIGAVIARLNTEVAGNQAAPSQPVFTQAEEIPFQPTIAPQPATNTQPKAAALLPIRFLFAIGVKNSTGRRYRYGRTGKHSARDKMGLVKNILDYLSQGAGARSQGAAVQEVKEQPAARAVLN